MKRRIILFCISFLLSIGIFAALYGSLHLANKMNGQQPAADTQTTEPQPAATETPIEPDPVPAEDTTSDAEETTDDAATTDEPGPEPEPATPATPEELERMVVEAVEAALKSEDPAAAMAELVDAGKVIDAASTILLTWRGRHEPNGTEHVGTIRPAGSDQDLSRWRMRSANGGEDILMDVVVTEKEASVVSATPTPSDKTQLSAISDSMTVAEGFIEAVRQGDMWAARGMVTGKEVSDATIAGLCMIFEEGRFALRTKSPIRNSFANDEHAGYIVYLVPQDGAGKTSNFGLELTKNDMWKVSGVSFDSLLASYEASGEAEGGHFFPIVKNPKGGDSLALFFSFDQAELSPRSLKQLQIVADLLKKSHGKLDISGHTDDIGSEQYNQKLSEKRALAVKAALVSFGVEEAQISTSGMGKNQPRRLPQNARNEEEADYIRGENRRAEIYLDFVTPDAQ